jgi:hypothetical protein
MPGDATGANHPIYHKHLERNQLQFALTQTERGFCRSFQVRPGTRGKRIRPPKPFCATAHGEIRGRGRRSGERSQLGGLHDGGKHGPAPFGRARRARFPPRGAGGRLGGRGPALREDGDGALQAVTPRGDIGSSRRGGEESRG